MYCIATQPVKTHFDRQGIELAKGDVVRVYVNRCTASGYPYLHFDGHGRIDSMSNGIVKVRRVRLSDGTVTPLGQMSVHQRFELELLRPIGHVAVAAQRGQVTRQCKTHAAREILNRLYWSSSHAQGARSSAPAAVGR